MAESGGILILDTWSTANLELRVHVINGEPSAVRGAV